MNPLSSRRCETCGSYTEIVKQDVMMQFHVCPVCMSAAILPVLALKPKPAPKEEWR